MTQSDHTVSKTHALQRARDRVVLLRRTHGAEVAWLVSVNDKTSPIQTLGPFGWEEARAVVAIETALQALRMMGLNPDRLPEARTLAWQTEGDAQTRLNRLEKHFRMEKRRSTKPTYRFPRSVNF